MRKENGFDLLWKDRITSPQDTLPLAADNLNVNLRRDNREITGLEPAIGDDGIGFINGIPLAVHHRRRFDPEFADPVAAHLFFNDRPDFYARDCSADGFGNIVWII